MRIRNEQQSLDMVRIRQCNLKAFRDDERGQGYLECYTRSETPSVTINTPPPHVAFPTPSLSDPQPPNRTFRQERQQHRRAQRLRRCYPTMHCTKI